MGGLAYRFRLLIYLFLAVSATSLFGNIQVNALASCSRTNVAAFRGSGQQYAESAEIKNIQEHLASLSGVNFVEIDNKIDFLSSEPKYAAVAIKGGGIENLNGGIALIGSSNFGAYRNSVNSGKNLLRKYIEHYEGTSECLVLVGYSQGAQVVGETVRDMHAEDPDSLKNVIYIGLLGDPEYSPNGYDTSIRPPWLRGDALYPFWGVLGPRSPEYVPHNPQNAQLPFTKVGSWCNYGDVICATNLTHYTAMRDGHGSYLTSGIPEMVREITAAIEYPDQNITNAIYPKVTCGPDKQDMVLLLDTSPIMRRNSDLFTDLPNDWDVRKTSSGARLPYRTTGQMLFESGCGDKRIAVVGYGRKQDGPPQLLLDFTTNPGDIDTLLKSLYQPSTSGIFERTQYREAAQLAADMMWRDGASHTIFALTNIPGDSSPAVAWPNAYGIETFFSDQIGQRLIAKTREKDIMLTGAVVPVSYAGYSRAPGASSEGDTSKFLFDMARATGGYNWVKYYNQYPSVPTFRNIQLDNTIRAAEQLRDASYATIKPIRIKVGQAVTLKVDDPLNLLASAKVRNDGVYYEWRPICSNLVESPYSLNSTYTFTPLKPGKCKAAVRVYAQGSGNGCYSVCPEPFPPYFNRLLTFDLEILPADYVPKIPSPVTNVHKSIEDTQVTYLWDAPTSSVGNVVYLVRDGDGAVLSATTERKFVVTDTASSDPIVQIQAMGDDGLSGTVSSDTAIVQDLRTKDTQSQPSVFSEEKTLLQPTYSSPPAIFNFFATSQSPETPRVLPVSSEGDASASNVTQVVASSALSGGKVESAATEAAKIVEGGELTFAQSDWWDWALTAIVTVFVIVITSTIAFRFRKNS